jgi:hypothetical protein
MTHVKEIVKGMLFGMVSIGALPFLLVRTFLENTL